MLPKITWMSLKITTPSEIHKRKMNTYCMITYNYKKFKLIHSDREWVRCYLGIGMGMGCIERRDCKGQKETFGDDGYIQYPDCGDGFMGT